MAKTRNEEPRTIPREEQTMPCPVCGYEQTQAEYWMRPTAGDGKNDGVPCLCCGVEIRVAVPFAVICAMPFGWRWVRVSSDRVEADTLFPEPCIAVTLPPGVHLTPEERTYLERLG